MEGKGKIDKTSADKNNNTKHTLRYAVGLKSERILLSWAINFIEEVELDTGPEEGE